MYQENYRILLDYPIGWHTDSQRYYFDYMDFTGVSFLNLFFSDFVYFDIPSPISVNFDKDFSN